VAPEKVELEGYRAHFFDLDSDQNRFAAFVNENGERIHMESGGPRFRLVGKEIQDAMDDHGPLFGCHPPSITVQDPQEWGNVKVMILGEEGSGRDRWRTQFSPKAGSVEQELRSELAGRRGGWYFIRVYDRQDNLLESMDFRFMTPLRGITVSPYKHLPDRTMFFQPRNERGFTNLGMISFEPFLRSIIKIGRNVSQLFSEDFLLKTG
jgi:hypothetical protein